MCIHFLVFFLFRKKLIIYTYYIASIELLQVLQLFGSRGTQLLFQYVSVFYKEVEERTKKTTKAGEEGKVCALKFNKTK